VIFNSRQMSLVSRLLYVPGSRMQKYY